MSIEIRNISKRFGDFKALDNVSLQVPAGELVALLGPSGSGKTTLLRIIAGLEFADRGSILLHEEETTEKSVRERKIGFVFQHYALFRHLTVFENVAFGLRVLPRRQKPSEEKIREKVTELLTLVQLDWLANQYPAQLSGGQRQRIALARALAVEPKVLLLDEPFGALDAKVRQELRKWLRRLHDELHITSVFVTHDQEEALEVADRIVVMNEGKIEQVGTPEEVYDRPATPFVFNFIGSVNLFHGRVHKGRAQIDGIEFDAPEHADTLLSSAVAYVRPHDIDLDRKRNGEQVIEAVVRHVNFIGPLVRLVVAHNGDSPVDVVLTRERYDELQLKEGEKVFVRPKKLKVFVEEYVI